jgi:hypothetical protein
MLVPPPVPPAVKPGPRIVMLSAIVEVANSEAVSVAATSNRESVRDILVPFVRVAPRTTLDNRTTTGCLTPART